MYTFEYHFYPKSFEEPLIEEFDDDMYWFISALEKNGQILSEYQNTVKLDDYYAYRVVAPEMDSLDKKYYNKYCREFLDSLTEKSLKPPELQFIGENYDVSGICECENIMNYILFANKYLSTSPIICGRCLESIPLYRFPKTYDNEEYWDILNWQKVYISCDIQFMKGIGEKHGYKMMNDPNSSLAKEGLQICSFLEQQTGNPFYYHLFKYYSKNKPICPKCGEDWVNNKKDELQYDYVCYKCRLVSNDIY